MKILAGIVLFAGWTAAHAATEAEIQRAFAQAQKKGAVAVMEERCGGTTSVYFPGATVESMAKTSAALTALAASRKDSTDPGECSAGLHQGDARLLELYPDGTVKAK